jgi:septal ring factor EnvC (AmiA/AmiB activator)
MLQEELMDARWQAQQSEFKSASLAESLQQAYAANWNQNIVVVQLQAQLRSLQTLYSQSQAQKAGLQTEINESKNAHKHTRAELDRVQMDKEAAWQAVQKIGELFTGIQHKDEKNRLNVNDNADLREYVTRLVIDNKKQEGEVNHLKGVVDKLKKFRSMELGSEGDSVLESGNIVFT